MGHLTRVATRQVTYAGTEALPAARPDATSAGVLKVTER
jgi:hypothetical protein